MARKGQADLESAAVRVRERDAAAVVLDELADDRQPESRTGAGIGAWPAPEAVKRPDSIVNVLDEDTAIDQGTYEFRLTNEDGTVTTLPARYTFVYERDARGRWKIVPSRSRT
jgi:Calcium/calmodulin dependent protein kinase II association domain